MTFEDHFSRLAGTYAQYRPRYPKQLFKYLADTTPNHDLAWDCATGSGQAARSLVEYYRWVVATDASEEQIEQAKSHERISYRVEPAEQTSLQNSSVDLAASAVAVHWFDFDRYYAEVRRVLKPTGIIAVWTYHRPQIGPEIDEMIAQFEDVTLSGYWPPRKIYLEEHYQTIPFPFEELASPEFFIELIWTAEQWLGFMNSWSAVRKYQEERGINPLSLIWEDFLSAWGGGDTPRRFRYPLYLRIGKV